MKFLQKILLIAMIGIAIANTDIIGMQGSKPRAKTMLKKHLSQLAPLKKPQQHLSQLPPLQKPQQINYNPILNLPDNTPGLQGDLQKQQINNVDTDCCHIVVPNAGVEGNIYFPTNGVQPTTVQAAQYSCAKIDNTEYSPITEWYMQMFAVIPIAPAVIAAAAPPVFVQACWNANASADQKIITFPAGDPKTYNSINQTEIADPDNNGAQISRIDLFRRKFRKIASTSVGRVLLYRILIEIRRHIVNTCCLESKISQPTATIGIRNQNRSISIYNSISSSYSYTRQHITLRVTNGTHTVIGSNKNNEQTAIGMSESSIDISLFHEMTHWYHYLRDPRRYGDECEANNLQQHCLGTYYWSELGDQPEWNEERRKISETYWTNFEEIRTILGATNPITNNGYREGDDLSENLYRMCVGYPIRFGHSNVPFYEDVRVINKAINVTIENYMFYVRGYTPPDDHTLMLRNGLGHYRDSKK